jgi:hypothetical protein
MSTESNKFVISAEELSDAAIDARVAELQAAAVPAMVRTVGAAPVQATGAARWLRGNLPMLALAGLLGGLLGWFLAELIARPDAVDRPLEGVAGAGTALFTSLFALGLGAIMASFEGLQLRSGAKVKQALAKSLPIVVGGAAVGGYLAQVMLFKPIMDSAYRRAVAADTFAAGEAIMLGALRLGRGVAFALMGIAIGCALGAATGAKQRAINGAIGGAVGGFAGGFVFDWIAIALGGDSGAISRLVALVLTGVLIGLAVGLVEQVRKDHWIEIVSGGMAGKQFILYHQATDVGSDPGCHVTLIKDPGIAGHHASMTQTHQGLLVRQVVPSAPVLINGQPVAEHVLRDGDVVQLGQTLLRYGQRGQAMPTLREA